MWRIVKKTNHQHIETLDPTSLNTNGRYSEGSQRLLQSIHERQAHIMCSCRDALMFVRHRGLYHLVNHPILGRHTEKCPFKTQISGKIEHGQGGDFVEAEDITTFCLHDRLVGNAEQEKKDTSVVCESSASSLRLSRLLNQLINNSFLNSYYKGKSLSTTQSMSILRKEAAKISFGSSTLDKFIFFGDKGWGYARARLATKWDTYPGRPHCLYIEMKETIEEVMPSVLLMDGELAAVHNLTHHYQRTCGPYLLISSITKDYEDIARNSTVILPIYRLNLPMPVDSDNERRVAGYLSRFVESAQTKVTFYKPLKAKAGGGGVALLPDFILNHKASSLRIIVEVMGFDTEEYKVRKQRLIPQMKTAFNGHYVYEVVSGVSYEEFESELLRVISQG